MLKSLTEPSPEVHLLTLVADICIWVHYCSQRTMPYFVDLYQEALLTHC